MAQLVYYLIALLFTFSSVAYSQPTNEQNWNVNVSVISDALTIVCSEFLLPSDTGTDLVELDPFNTDTGEFSQTLKSSHFIKATLQPESGTTDTIANISGCTVDGTWLLLKTNDVGDTITLTSTGNINPPGASVTLDNVEDMVLLNLQSTTWYVVGGTGGTVSGSGCTTLDECFDGGNVINNATPLVPFELNRGGDDAIRQYIADDGTPTYEGRCDAGSCSHENVVLPGDRWFITDGLLGPDVVQIFPDAPTLNEMYRFFTGYEPLISAEVSLLPSGNCTVAETSVVAGASLDYWITCADATDDAVSFSYMVTGKIAGDTTAKITMLATCSQASCGTFSLNCAEQSTRPGSDPLVAHNTANPGSVSFSTFGSANIPIAASATMTINGTVTTGAYITGRCDVSVAPAEIADIRLRGSAVIELFANSLSD